MNNNNNVFIELNNDYLIPKLIRANQYYPTEVRELFLEEISLSTRDKWESYLSRFDLGELKNYIWIQLESFTNSGWMYLLRREIAFRNDSLSNIYSSYIGNEYSYISWIVWTNKWIYMGMEMESDYIVISIPKDDK